MNRRDFLKYSSILAASSLPLQLAAAEEKRARITFAGDTLLGGYYHSGYGTMLDLVNKIDSIKAKEGLPGVVNHFFQHVMPLFHDSDFSALNFEGPLTPRLSVAEIERKMIDKPIPLRQHEDAGTILKLAGVDLVSLANNHMWDFNGQEGLLYTMKSLEIDYVGAGEGEAAYAYKLEEIKGIKFAFLGFNAILDPGSMLAVPGKVGVAGFPKFPGNLGERGLKYAVDSIAKARQEADFVVVIMHAGPIGGSAIDQSQIEIADFLIQKGVDLMVGSHSHARQPIKKVGEQVVFYGLGNFIFGGKRSRQSLSMIPVVDFTIKDGQKSISYEAHNIYPNNGDFVPVLA